MEVDALEPLTVSWPGWQILEAMASGDLSGDAAKVALATHFLPLYEEDRGVILCILDKTWRAGVTQDTINQAQPGTFRPAKLMLAHKLKERLEHDAKQLAKGKPWDEGVGDSLSPFEVAGAINREGAGLYVQLVEVSYVTPLAYQTTELAIATDEIASVGTGSVAVIVAS